MGRHRNTWRKPRAGPGHGDDVAGFSQDVKNELVLGLPERECCQKALVAALFLDQAHMETRDDGLPVCVFETWSSPCVRLVLRLVRRFDSPPVTWEARHRTRFREGVQYTVRLGPAPRLGRFLGTLGFVPPCAGSGPLVYEYTSLKRKCCKRTFLRGVFLTSGSVVPPTRGYHLEWALRHPGSATTLQAILAEFGVDCRSRSREYHTVLYLKGSNHIALALNLMGAHGSLLRFEEVRAVRETKNQVHRRVNCDTANLARSSRVAVRQVGAVEFLQGRVGLASLPAELRQVARVRLRHPEASYVELGRRLEPVASKVLVGRRLVRLEKMAADLGYSQGRASGEADLRLAGTQSHGTAETVPRNRLEEDT